MTTTIPRPQRRASDEGGSRLGRFTRRGSRDGRIAPRRRLAWLFGLAAVVVAGAIGAALFGLPVRTWFEQDDQLAGLEHELTELQSVNNDLETEVRRLQTDDGITEAAREELGHIEPGDRRDTMLALPPLPRDLPDGWPYSQVDHIMAIRAAADAPPPSSQPGGSPAGDDAGGGWVLPQPTPPPVPSAVPTTTSSSAAVAGATSAPAGVVPTTTVTAAAVTTSAIAAPPPSESPTTSVVPTT